MKVYNQKLKLDENGQVDLDSTINFLLDVANVINAAGFKVLNWSRNTNVLNASTLSIDIQIARVRGEMSKWSLRNKLKKLGFVTKSVIDVNGKSVDVITITATVPQSIDSCDSPTDDSDDDKFALERAEDDELKLT